MTTSSANMSTPVESSQVLDDYATPIISDGRISDTFLNPKICFDQLPASPESTPEVEPIRGILDTHLWLNQLYVKRAKKNPKFIKFHQEIFPKLTAEQMSFVFYHFFAQKKQISAVDWESWNTPQEIKTYVQQRIAQIYEADH